MAITLNHTIVAARDKLNSSMFLAQVLGLAAPTMAGHFAVVQVGDTSLDFVETQDIIAQRHFAFLVSEAEFDEIFNRLTNKALSYWADPFRREPGQINRWDDGRGLYFDDPSSHLLEIITRAYGSGGAKAKNPHPLFFPKR